MERKYDIPFVEASFFGSTETAKALRAIAKELQGPGAEGQGPGFRVQGPGEADIIKAVEMLIKSEEKKLKEALKPYQHLRGKKAVLYTGGVKSWSFISALQDLGIEVVAVGTKKSTIEDEEKMKAILGPDAPLVEDVTPKNLLKLLKERNADMLIAGGRNQYLAIKAGYPFVDVNQERHTAYAGYAGLVNLAEQISNGMRFYKGVQGPGSRGREEKTEEKFETRNPKLNHSILINPLKHSPAIGAAMALQGIDKALPIIHGAQGCTFLGKVLLTKHFREPIALASSKLFVEEVVMGSEDKLSTVIDGFVEKNSPALIGVLFSGLSEVKGDDVEAVVRRQESGVRSNGARASIIHVATADYDGGLEIGYARAVEAIVQISDCGFPDSIGTGRLADCKQVNVLAGSHLTPADFAEIRDLVADFGMSAIILPDLSALDGSRGEVSPLATGGTSVDDVRRMGQSVMTIALGMSMEPAAKLLQQKFGMEYRVFESVAGLADADHLMQTLSAVSGRPVPTRQERRRRVLQDTMRDAHFFFGGKKICLALEPDLAAQTSKWLDEMGATPELAIIPTLSPAADHIRARDVRIGDLFSITGDFDLLIANSHGESAAKRLGVPLYEMGFPVYKTLGYTSKVFIGYRGTTALINEVGSLLMHGH
jgi:nitrogenase molybdenum-cofactor synthesis protein NifE